MAQQKGVKRAEKVAQRAKKKQAKTKTAQLKKEIKAIVAAAKAK